MTINSMSWWHEAVSQRDSSPDFRLGRIGRSASPYLSLSTALSTYYESASTVSSERRRPLINANEHE